MTQYSPTGSVLILGAGSGIARAVARTFAAAGHPLILAARSEAALNDMAQDLRLRGGANVTSIAWDLLDEAGAAVWLDKLGVLPDIVVCAAGVLGDQFEQQRSAVAADLVMRTNYLAPALLLGEIANRMEVRGSGHIVGISSVAGDRGRASNYLYGSAKAGFTAFLSGLRNRLAKRGVAVITVKPGFVDTSMTAGMNLPKALTAQPEEVAGAILRAVREGRDVIYVRPVWRLIMAIIAHIPERVFKRLSL
jgi:short-subunit dehydrogenase